MKPKVFVTREIPEAGLRILQASAEVHVNREDRTFSRSEIIAGVRGCHGLLCLLTDRIDEEVMADSQLKVISNYAVGYDNIDVEAATERGIMVTNTPVEGLRETPADFTFALILGLARRVCEGDRLVREGGFQGWAPLLLLGKDVHGKTLGIVGGGRIGSAVARRARGFEMRILYHDVVRNHEMESTLGCSYVPLDVLLAESDFITLHVPLTEETRHLIGAKEIARMKKTAFLINTSRGPVVDEAGLARALRKEAISGAALDVYEDEPNVHKDLLTIRNVLLLPHMASATLETRTEMAVTAAQNILDALEGRTPRFLVNPEVSSYRARE